MNKRNFIITTGAVLAFIMLATCYAAVTALRSDDVPSVTEEYRQSTLPGGAVPFREEGHAVRFRAVSNGQRTLPGGGNPFLQIRDDFAEIFQIIGSRMSGQ